MDKKRSKKSTLTQQQRNNKRQRANAQQLDVLRLEYRVCATPDAATRRRISAMIDMTERSVQIWFQNTRAKQKKAQRGRDVFEDEGGVESYADVSVDVNADISTNLIADVSTNLISADVSADVSREMGNFFVDTHVTSHVTTLCEPITPVTAGHVHGLATPPTASSHVTCHVTSASAASPAPSTATDFSSSLGHVTPNLTPTTPHHVTLPPIFFPTLSLTIGNWRRLSPQLSLAYYPATDTMSYHMTSDKTQFRMQFPFSAIDEIHVSRNPNENLGALNLTLSQAPSFSIQTPKVPGRWVGCHDFSEGKQASHVTTHVCNGPATVLQQQLSRVFALRQGHVNRMQAGGIFGHVVGGHVASHVTHVTDHVTSHASGLASPGLASPMTAQVDTSDHMISSHVGDFPLDSSVHVTDHVSDHVTSHVSTSSPNYTSSTLGNVTPGHTTPVLDTGFDLGHVTDTDLDALVNVAHLLPANHVTDAELQASCHMMSSNAFTLDPSTPLSPFSGTLDYLEYY